MQPVTLQSVANTHSRPHSTMLTWNVYWVGKVTNLLSRTPALRSVFCSTASQHGAQEVRHHNQTHTDPTAAVSCVYVCCWLLLEWQQACLLEEMPALCFLVQQPAQGRLTSTHGAGSSSPRSARTATSNRPAPNSLITLPVLVSTSSPSSPISRPATRGGKRQAVSLQLQETFSA